MISDMSSASPMLQLIFRHSPRGICGPDESSSLETLLFVSK